MDKFTNEEDLKNHDHKAFDAVTLVRPGQSYGVDAWCAYQPVMAATRGSPIEFKPKKRLLVVVEDDGCAETKARIQAALGIRQGPAAS